MARLVLSITNNRYLKEKVIVCAKFCEVRLPIVSWSFGRLSIVDNLVLKFLYRTHLN